MSSRCSGAGGATRLPKGISAPTLELVVAALRESDGELTAVAVGEQTGISRGTARRYLEYLALTGAIELVAPVRHRRPSGASVPLGRSGARRPDV